MIIPNWEPEGTLSRQSDSSVGGCLGPPTDTHHHHVVMGGVFLDCGSPSQSPLKVRDMTRSQPGSWSGSAVACTYFAEGIGVAQQSIKRSHCALRTLATWRDTQRDLTQPKASCYFNLVRRTQTQPTCAPCYFIFCYRR